MLSIELNLIAETALRLNAPAGGPQRDDRGRFIVSANTLKGAHRRSAETLAGALGLPVCASPQPQRMCHPLAARDACPVCQIFGSPWLAGGVFYRDAVATAPAPPTAITFSRAGQSRLRRRLTDQRTHQAYVIPAGTTLTTTLLHRVTVPGLLGLLLASLRALRTLGASNAVGFGLCRVEYRAFDARRALLDEADYADALAELAKT
jgi:hypothetical protein